MLKNVRDLDKIYCSELFFFFFINSLLFLKYKMDFFKIIIRKYLWLKFNLWVDRNIVEFVVNKFMDVLWFG